MATRNQTYRTRLAKYLRTRRGKLSQAEFAKKLSISQSTLARIECEDQNVTIDMLELMCKRLKCNLSELIPGS
ncbi:helix-turn-helix domain-containing protein [Oceanicoccus sagamiensis]|uniref:HTH cro/C1-type domain-containing protein n=1 Tax=Oceanicoccus sagamiensis TaxID=716816 RepID=A0A1X9NI57_9GAMM|nr:hypothetical protein BST96_14390 [Oceanicoccus sagamiensis]